MPYMEVTISERSFGRMRSGETERAPGSRLAGPAGHRPELGSWAAQDIEDTTEGIGIDARLTRTRRQGSTSISIKPIARQDRSGL